MAQNKFENKQNIIEILAQLGDRPTAAANELFAVAPEAVSKMGSAPDKNEVKKLAIAHKVPLNKKFEAKLAKSNAKIASFNSNGRSAKDGPRGPPAPNGKRKTTDKATMEVQLAGADWDVPVGTVLGGHDAVELVDQERARAVLAQELQEG